DVEVAARAEPAGMGAVARGDHRAAHAAGGSGGDAVFPAADARAEGRAAGGVRGVDVGGAQGNGSARDAPAGWKRGRRVLRRLSAHASRPAGGRGPAVPSEPAAEVNSIRWHLALRSRCSSSLGRFRRRRSPLWFAMLLARRLRLRPLLPTTSALLLT